MFDAVPNSSANILAARATWDRRCGQGNGAAAHRGKGRRMVKSALRLNARQANIQDVRSLVMVKLRKTMTCSPDYACTVGLYNRKRRARHLRVLCAYLILRRQDQGDHGRAVAATIHQKLRVTTCQLDKTTKPSFQKKMSALPPSPRALSHRSILPRYSVRLSVCMLTRVLLRAT